MAVIVSILAPPTGLTATLIEGGSLAANTTYYVRICARSRNDYYYTSNKVSSPSDVISFTTTDTAKSVRIDWIKTTGAVAYSIYCSTDDTNYYGKRCGSGAIMTAGNVSTYTISTIANGITLDSFAITTAILDKFPCSIERNQGNIFVYISGSETIDSVYNQIVTAGYGSYVYYDGFTFCIKGCIEITGTTAGSLIVTRKNILFLHGTIRNYNPNFVLQFGNTTSSGVTYDGCSICIDLLGSVYPDNIKYYNCAFISSFPGIPYVLMNSSYVYQPTILLNTIIKNCSFDGYSLRGTGYPINDITVNIFGYAYWTGESKNVVQQNGYQNIYSVYTPSFREWRHNHLTHHFSVALISGATIKIYNCDYTINFTKTTDNLPIIRWYTNGIGRTFEIYNSLSLKVTDQEGNAISGANVVLKNKNDEIVLNAITDETGCITTIDILRHTLNYVGSGTGYADNLTVKTSYSPFCLTISKAGFQIYEQAFNLTDKINWTIALDLEELRITSLSQSHCTLPDSKDGIITIAATGGTQPYQYSIDGGLTYRDSGSFTGLAAGEYQAKVKDADESETGSFEVKIINPAIDTTYAAIVKGEIREETIRGEIKEVIIRGEIKEEVIKGTIIVTDLKGDVNTDQLTGKIQ